MGQKTIDWQQLEALVTKATEPGLGPGTITEAEWNVLEHSLNTLTETGDKEGTLELRGLFKTLFARDTAAGLPLLQRLDNEAIAAAKQLNDKRRLAELLGARGHNLHRQGYHELSIATFEQAAALFREVGDSLEALKNYYMTSLCHRALGHRAEALQVIDHVLGQMDQEEPWRGNPLQVLAWLTQDDGRLEEAERLLREAIRLQKKGDDPYILVAGALADLAEVVGLQGRPAEAEWYFEQSLVQIREFGGQYERQEARTLLKYAELLWRQNKLEQALNLLNQADDKIRAYGHYYDLLWRVELARAAIFFKQRKLGTMAKKLRSTLRLRQALGLSSTMLVQQLLTRLRSGTGLPR